MKRSYIKVRLLKSKRKVRCSFGKWNIGGENAGRRKLNSHMNCEVLLLGEKLEKNIKIRGNLCENTLCFVINYKHLNFEKHW
jgi:hypothetical protein